MTTHDPEPEPTLSDEQETTEQPESNDAKILKVNFLTMLLIVLGFAALLMTIGFLTFSNQPNKQDVSVIKLINQELAKNQYDLKNTTDTKVLVSNCMQHKDTLVQLVSSVPRQNHATSEATIHCSLFVNELSVNVMFTS